jgi:transposase
MQNTLEKRTTKSVPVEIRRKIIKAYEKGYTVNLLADIYGCHISTIIRFLKKYYEDGAIEPKKRGRANNKKVQDIHKEAIKQYINDSPTATLKEIQHKLQDDFKLNVSHTTINNYINSYNFKFNYSFKRVTNIKEMNNNDETKQIRRAYANSFIDWSSRWGLDNIYFIDRIEYKIETRDKYERLRIGTKATKNALEKQTNNIVCVACMNRTEPFYFLQQRAYNSLSPFFTYIVGIVQKLHKNKVEKALLIMDNANFHKLGSRASFINDEGYDYLLLPPNTPNLNPIEKLFHQWKTNIEKEKCRDRFDLDKAINSSLGKITKESCIDFFNDMTEYFEPSLQERDIE